MKCTLLYLLLFVFFAIPAFPQSKIDLRYNQNGEFKIVQFTDLHLKRSKSSSNEALGCIKAILTEEQPDLAVITGDMVYSKHVEESINKICEVFQQFEIPFACVFGNHDSQFDMSLPQMYDKYSSYSYNVQPLRDSLDYSPDYMIPIRTSDTSSNIISSVLYCFDSHSSCRMKGWKGYDWIHFNQLKWFIESNENVRNDSLSANSNSFVFLHIPLPEFALAAMDTGVSLYGNFGENVCCPPVNSGLFTALLEAGNVCAVFAGHDHDNDFSVFYKGILLAYGRYSGADTVYNNLKPNGARVILLNENKEYSTWIRLSDGSMTQYLNSATLIEK